MLLYMALSFLWLSNIPFHCVYDIFHCVCDIYSILKVNGYWEYEIHKSSMGIFQTQFAFIWWARRFLWLHVMTTFYEFLADKKNAWNKRKAFEEAKEIIRQKHPDPFHWAAFVMLDWWKWLLFFLFTHKWQKQNNCDYEAGRNSVRDSPNVW